MAVRDAAGRNARHGEREDRVVQERHHPSDRAREPDVPLAPAHLLGEGQ